MQFIDHTGHIFTIESFHENPLGYEYEEQPYIFWFNTEYGYKLSVNNYYFQPIRILINANDIIDLSNVKIEITAQDKSIFKLMGSKQLQDLLKDRESFLGNIELNENLFVSKLTTEDIYIVDDIQDTTYKYYIETYNSYGDGSVGPYTGPIYSADGKTYADIDVAGTLTTVEIKQFENKVIIPDEESIVNDMYNGHQVYSNANEYIIIPFYALVKTDNEGCWTSNTLIKITVNDVDEYCFITLGAEVVDDNEELVINGTNMGVKLPKQIIKAVYNGNYYSDYPDERMYANKLKEYLMNLMDIKGSKGNMQSVIKSLKWFNWGDKINIYQLLKTDNDFQLTYVRDAFDIQNDTIFTFNNFRLATLVSLGVKINQEVKETQQIYDDDVFWGELKPEMEDLLTKMVLQKYDETNIEFYRGYFDYVFEELGLKLCALKYYFKKYFLPIHLGENTVSLEHQCFMNDTKLMIRPSTLITQAPLFTNGYKQCLDYTIEFPKLHTLYFNHEVHYVDANYCEFGHTKEDGEKEIDTVYFINDTVVSVPIHFIQEKEEQYYNCILILKKDDIRVHEAHFSFTQNKTVNGRKSWFYNFVIHPKTMNTILTGDVDEKFNINYWLDSSYTIYLCVNNIWYNYSFKMAVPELSISLGKLEYQYYLDATKNYINEHERPSLFRQLRNYTMEDGEVTNINFNSFMFQPDLVSVTNANFIEEICDYAERENLVFLDEKTLETGSFYYYLEYNGVKYIFSNKQNKILKQDKNGIITIIDDTTHNILIKYEGNGTYSLLFKDLKKRVVNLNLQTNMYSNLASYIDKYYVNNNNFIDNKYLNQIHLIDFYDKDWNKMTFEAKRTGALLGTMVLAIDILGDPGTWYKKITYYHGGNEYGKTRGMYGQFFKPNGDSILDVQMELDSTVLDTALAGKKLGNNLNETKDIEYDFYLMHNDENWHIILISKNTVDNFVNKDTEFKFPSNINTLTITKDNKWLWGYNSEVAKTKAFLKVTDDRLEEETPASDITKPQKTYYLVYNRGSKDILLNRLQYKPSDGVNQFENDDIISCTLTNNDKLPFKLEFGSKWVFTPASLRMNEESTVTSDTEMALISMGKNNSKYSAGYYTVSCNYSLDDFVTHTFKQSARFRVNKT